MPSLARGGDPETSQPSLGRMQQVTASWYACRAVRLPALWLAGRRLVYEVKRVFVALRDGWRRLPQIGALMTVDVAASKKTATFGRLVFGRIPHGLIDTDKVAGVLAPAVGMFAEGRQSSYT
jgi:hypothetical protein